MNGIHSLPADFRGIIEECAHRAMDEDVEGIPEWERFRVISHEVGAFLYILARAASRRRIVVMDGPGGAGSAIIWLAGAADQVDGEVIAWESNPRRWVKLQNVLSRARLSPNVELRTADPLWLSGDEGGVIAPPAADESDANRIEEEPVYYSDMVVVTLTEPDWPERLSHGWELLEPNGILVLTDTYQAGESADVILGQFFESRPAAVVGIQLGEGGLLALKPASTTDSSEQIDPSVDSFIPNAELVGEKAAAVLEMLQTENKKPGSNLWAIPPITGKFLWILLTSMNAERVLEIGSSGGYSGTWIASALKQTTGGKLTTIEIENEKVATARDSFGRAGVLDHVEVIHGDAMDIVPTLDDKYDMVFLDCSKEYYFDLLEPILWRVRRGGILIADNVISHKDQLGSYLDTVKQHSSLMSITLPIGSGEELTMVL